MQNQTYEDKNTKLNEVACHFSLIYGPSKFLISLHINISIRNLYIDNATYFYCIYCLGNLCFQPTNSFIFLYLILLCK